MTEQHHIRVNVSPAAFAANIRHLRALAHPSKVCVVMKANAYGHGLRPLASVAIEAGADYLGICTNPEAALIREAHREVKIMRLRAALPEELARKVSSGAELVRSRSHVRIEVRPTCVESFDAILGDLPGWYSDRHPNHRRRRRGRG